jgi:Tfp pilus assembly protein PilF
MTCNPVAHVHRLSSSVLESLLAAAIIFSLVAGASAQSAKSPAKKKGPGADSPPTQEELLAFAKRYEEAANIGAGELNALFDWDAFIEKAGRDTGLDKNDLKDVKKGFKPAQSVVKEICESARKDGSYRFLHILRKGNTDYLLFRLLSDGGFNYHLLMLGRDKTGELKVADIGFYTLGELFSQTMHRAILEVLATMPGAGAARAKKKNPEALDFGKLAEMVSAKNKENYQEALNIYQKLPEKLQHDKHVLVLRCQIAQKVNDTEYVAAMEAFRKEFPRDPALLILSIDYLFLKMRYPEAHQVVTELSKVVEGDPYLDFLQANIFSLEEKWDEARDSAQRALKAEPNLLPAVQTAVAISLAQHDYTATRTLLNRLEKDLGQKVTDLKGDDKYAGFVASPEYAAWMAGRGKSAAGAK